MGTLERYLKTEHRNCLKKKKISYFCTKCWRKKSTDNLQKHSGANFNHGQEADDTGAVQDTLHRTHSTGHTPQETLHTASRYISAHWWLHSTRRTLPCITSEEGKTLQVLENTTASLEVISTLQVLESTTASLEVSAMLQEHHLGATLQKHRLDALLQELTTYGAPLQELTTSLAPLHTTVSGAAAYVQ